MRQRIWSGSRSFFGGFLNTLLISKLLIWANDVDLKKPDLRSFLARFWSETWTICGYLAQLRDSRWDHTKPPVFQFLQIQKSANVSMDFYLLCIDFRCEQPKTYKKKCFSVQPVLDMIITNSAHSTQKTTHFWFGECSQSICFGFCLNVYTY